MRDVRDRGLGVPQERETRDTDVAGGGQEGSQDWDDGANAGAVWTRDWQGNTEVNKRMVNME